jgi:hypothetical protein
MAIDLQGALGRSSRITAQSLTPHGAESQEQSASTRTEPNTSPNVMHARPHAHTTSYAQCYESARR